MQEYMRMIDEIKAEIKRMKKTSLYTSQDYYSGYMSACNHLEGYLAMIEKKYQKHTCKECKYYPEKAIGKCWHVCLNPDKEVGRKYSNYRRSYSVACKLFEPKEINDVKD